MRYRKWIWVLLSVAFYQANDVSMRILTVDTNFIAGCVLQALPLVIFSGFLLAKEHGFSQYKRGKRVLAFICGYGIVQVLIGNLLYFLAMRFGGLSVASPAVQSQAIWAVLLGAALLREVISPQGWLGVGCFAMGIALLTYFKSRGESLHPLWLVGAVFGLLAGLCWAGGSLLQKKLFAVGTSQNAIFFLGTLLGITLLCLCGLAVIPHAFIQSFTRPHTYQMLIPGLFNSLATWCFANALRQLPLSVVIPLLSVNIIFNSITGALFWGEYVSTGTMCGLLMAFLGILFSQNIQRKRREAL